MSVESTEHYDPSYPRGIDGQLQESGPDGKNGVLRGTDIGQVYSAEDSYREGVLASLRLANEVLSQYNQPRSPSETSLDDDENVGVGRPLILA